MQLLGKESDDIDIALDDIYGEEFAKLIQQYLNKDMGETDKKVNFGVIKANTEKGKHLETAAIKVHDIFIDLVNLRSDDYTNTSKQQIGTPKEDAMRRDLTINSMFYNINASEVEDFTGMGLQDMQAKLIRTPLKAVDTFMDDPLRMIRSVRFAHRFGFMIHEEIVQAAQN